MKMDIAGSGGAEAHGWQSASHSPATTGSSSVQRVGGNFTGEQFHNIIMLYHYPLLVAHKINVREGRYLSCCLDLTVIVNLLFHFHWFALWLMLTGLTAQVDWYSSSALIHVHVFRERVEIEIRFLSFFLNKKQHGVIILWKDAPSLLRTITLNEYI